MSNLFDDLTIDDVSPRFHHADGEIFIPIPNDPTQAHRLYDTDPVVHDVLNVYCGQPDISYDVRHVLENGPRVISVEKEKLGL